MDELRRLVRFARRRLIVQVWLRALPWCISAGLLVSCVLLAFDRRLAWQMDAWVWPVAGTVAGLLAACAWAWHRRVNELDAAIEIDRRLQLRERVSSSCALDADTLQTAAGRALLDDARSRLERQPLAGEFRLSASRWSWLPIVPGAVAAGIAMLVNPADLSHEKAQAAAHAVEQKQIERSSETLRKKLSVEREAAKRQGLKSADEVFSQLEQGTKQLNSPSVDRKQALVKLNDLADELAKRQALVAGAGKLADQLKQLKGIGRGPADPLAKALERGNLADAARELRALAGQLNEGKFDQAQQKQLAEQLKQLEKKLEQMADAKRRLEKDLNEQIAEHRAAGRNAEADRLEQQKQQAALGEQARQLQKMAEKLGQAAKNAAAGQGKQAAGELAEMQKDLEQLGNQLAEGKLLDEALEALADAKDGMACKHCDGAGCEHCQGGEPADGGDHADGRDQQGGKEWGRGTGELLGPEQKPTTPGYDSRVRQRIGRGPGKVVDLTDGPNARGRVQQQIQQEWSGAAGGQEDPLADEPLPADYRQHAKKYFDSIREGR